MSAIPFDGSRFSAFAPETSRLSASIPIRAPALGRLMHAVHSDLAQPGHDEQIVAGRIVLTPDGRPIRSIITGRRHQVTGSYASRKAGQGLVFESMNEHDFYQECEVDPRVIDYDPQATAVLTVQEVEQLIWEALAVYHLDVHSGIGTPPALQWAKDAEAYGIAVYDSARELEKMLGVPVKRQLSRSGIELHGLQYHDPAAVGALLTDLAVVAPQREQRRSGSITCKVTVKYNPANLNEVQVWHHLQKRYVTLPCTEPEYAQGLSLWHHERVKQWSKEAGLRFSSLQDRLEARARLIEQVERLAPELKMRQRRALARLLHAPANRVGEGLVSGVVEVEIAPSRHDGLAPIIPQVALASERTDGSVRPSRPPRPPSRPKTVSTRKAKSNDTAAFSSRLADAPWKEFE